MSGAPQIWVFAREPLAGRVKTRLIPARGAEGACRLHAALVEHTLATATGAGMPVQLWLAGDPRAAQVRQWAERFALTVHAQRGAGLGERMWFAARRQLRRRRAVLLIGTDCPALDRATLLRARDALGRRDAVIVPAHDGGYVLLGLRAFAPGVFERVPWGTRGVLRVTRSRLRRAGLRWRELPWRHDIDRPGDLAHLPGRLLLERLA